MLLGCGTDLFFFLLIIFILTENNRGEPYVDYSTSLKSGLDNPM